MKHTAAETLFGTVHALELPAPASLETEAGPTEPPLPPKATMEPLEELARPLLSDEPELPTG